jgi:hypothetical protein
MKPSYWIIMMLAAGSLVFADGCKKQEKPSEWKTEGVRVSMTELRQAFPSAPGAEIEACLNDAATGLHYGEYAKVLAALDKLANNPGSTAQQKKVIGKVIGQVKELAAKSQARYVRIPARNQRGPYCPPTRKYPPALLLSA